MNDVKMMLLNWNNPMPSFFFALVLFPCWHATVFLFVTLKTYIMSNKKTHLLRSCQNYIRNIEKKKSKKKVLKKLILDWKKTRAQKLASIFTLDIV